MVRKHAGLSRTRSIDGLVRLIHSACGQVTLLAGDLPLMPGHTEGASDFHRSEQLIGRNKRKKHCRAVRRAYRRGGCHSGNCQSSSAKPCKRPYVVSNVAKALQRPLPDEASREVIERGSGCGITARRWSLAQRTIANS